MSYGYDRNVDYQQLINQDLINKDYRSAAIHEAQRNEKIRGEGATEYQPTDHYSAWLPQTDTINNEMDRLSSYRYDHNQDPEYQALRKEYLREADRQTRDTMGAYAGMTGGVPSSYAVSAAQQAGNYQRALLTDKIPELAQQDFNRKYNALQLRQDIEQSRIRDSENAESQARSQAMQIWATLGYANDYVSQVLGVPVGTLTSDQTYQQWQQHQAAEQQQYQQQQDQIGQAMQMWAALGYANAFVASVLGVKEGTLTSDQAYQNWYMKTNGGQNGSGSGGGSGGHGGSAAMGPGTNSEGGGSANAGTSNHTPVPAQMGGPSEEELAAAAAAGGYSGGSSGWHGGNPRNYGPGLDNRTFSGMKQLIRQYMNEGKFEEAQALLAKFEGMLDEAQYTEIESMFT